MEGTLLLEIFGLVIGGGGLIGFGVGVATFRWQKMKARGEARQSELEATRTEQDMYQEIITDLKEHNEVLRQYNKEVNEDCEQLRQRIGENEKRIHEQDVKIREQEEKLREQENKIATLEHKLELVTDMICGRSNCQQRTKVYLSPVDDDSFTARKDK